MSTRALYTFLPEDENAQAWNVYKHHDGYPSGAAEVLQHTLDWFAWKLPRYESDEFAAAFIAAGKAHFLIAYATAKNIDEWKSAKKYFPEGDYRGFSGGGVRLMPQGDPCEVAKTNCSDIEYRYEISAKKDKLWIRAFDNYEKGSKPFFAGPFNKFVTFKEVVES